INLHLNDVNGARELFGTNDKFLQLIEAQIKVEIVTRGEQVSVSGEDPALVQVMLHSLLQIIRKGLTITERDVVYAIKLAKEGNIEQFETLFEDEITKNAKGKSSRVKTLGQKAYIDAMHHHDLVFGIGPAGTGKTYFAVVKSVDALKKGELKSIVLTRLAIVAGTSLGFVPRDLKDKIDLYVRSLYDGL